MAATDHSLSETDIRSPGSQMWTVRATDGDDRPWLQVAPLCPALQPYHIAHLGHGIMPAPFEIVRMRLGGSYFFSCSGGAGEVLVDGRWKRCVRGQAFLLSPGTSHAFRALPDSRWEFSWVRFREEAGQAPVSQALSPVLAELDPEPVRHAALGLHHACRRPELPSAIGLWVELLVQYVQNFAQPAAPDPRLATLWQRVSADLTRPWNSREMAAIAHVSEKQLERLCRRELGRTPRQQLIWLRIRRAGEILVERADSIESVANQVGYSNPFTFSNTFRRLTGWSPSRYPGRARA